jgi:hypothetical protein
MEINYYIIYGFGIMVPVAIAVWLLIRARKPAHGKKYPRKDYKFSNGVEAYQEQLDLDQLEVLAPVLAQMDIADLKGLNMKHISEILFKKQLIRKLMKVVLVSESDITDDMIGALKHEELEAVLNDFFILNPKMKAYFGIIMSAVVSGTLSGKQKEMLKSTTNFSKKGIRDMLNRPQKI